MRCARCGNENGEGNRFCGMCGAPLAPATQGASPAAKQPPTAVMAGQSAGRSAAQEVRQERASANPATTSQASPSSASSAPVSSAPARPASPPVRQREEPVISGPSFLGLNQPGPARSGRDNDRHGDSRDHLHSSGNLNYLLQDDEYEEPKRGWGKVLLVLVALALAGGFGYLHWKQGGFNWLLVGNSKPAAAQAPADSAQAPADSGGAVPANAGPGTASDTSGTTANGTAPSTTTVPSAGATAPAGTPAAPSGTAAPAQAGTLPGTAAAAPAGTAPTTEATANSAPGSATPASASAASDQANETPSNTAEPTSASGSAAAGAATQSSEEEQTPASAVAPPKAAPKPRAPKPAPAKPSDAVTEAKQYIYGRGVRQDCDRGVRMLKSAAGRSDANAMIYLGVLYSQGTCAPRDLPTAYHWFALGLHREPDNQALQEDLQQLWSQMTQPERQLAIKLSQ